ncbi:MAG TPA: PEGA domain-containing protein [Gemmatimonadales bacterium]|nr:PEGA domain-containing protein [Gemmatimonadales bacterium]
MTTRNNLRHHVLLVDDWEPPPRKRNLRPALKTAGLVLVIAVLTIAPFRVPIRDEMSSVLEQDWEARRSPVAAVDPLVDTSWSSSESARVLTETRVPAAPPPPPPAASALPGYLSINSNPWAVVLVDGTLVGNTPLSAIRVTPGQHELALGHDTFVPRRILVRVPPGDTLLVTNIVLQRVGP